MVKISELRNAAIAKGQEALTAVKNNPGKTALGVVAVGGAVALAFAPVRAAAVSVFTSYIAPFATASYLVMKGAFLKLAATHAVSVIAAAIGLSSVATLSLGIGLVALLILGIAAYVVRNNNKPKAPAKGPNDPSPQARAAEETLRKSGIRVEPTLRYDGTYAPAEGKPAQAAPAASPAPVQAVPVVPAEGV